MRARATAVGLIATLGLALSLVAPAIATTSDGIPETALGQPLTTSFGCNTGGRSAASLCAPSGVAVDPATGRLFVADSANSRVLSWVNTHVLQTGEPADLVLGQADFTAAEAACAESPSAASISASTLCAPEGVALDNSVQLYVTDTGNDRVLRYSPPFNNGQAADLVLGQATFDTGALGDLCADTQGQPVQPAPPTAATLCGPRGIAVDASGRLYVADTFYHRVLRFNPPTANGEAADLVLGQPDFTSGCFICGQTPAPLSAQSLSLPSGVWLGSGGTLFVADFDRVLRYTQTAENEQVADLVLGAPDFTTISPTACAMHDEDVRAITSAGVCRTGGGAVGRQGEVWVADTDNNRLLRFEPPLSNGKAAAQVIGQADFTHGGCPGVPGAGRLCLPVGVAVDFRGDLWVVDRFDGRLLRYEEPRNGTPPMLMPAG